jgi:hypothetical protein
LRKPVKLKKNDKKTGAYIVMIAGLILLIINIYELDFSNLKNVPFSGIALNVLLILAIIISVRNLNRKEKK